MSSDVLPPNQNPGVAPEHIYNLVDVIVSSVATKYSKKVFSTSTFELFLKSI